MRAAAAALLLLLAAAAAAEPANIARANDGGIVDYRLDGPRIVYLEARDGRWFRADMTGPCLRPGFDERLGYITAPGGRFDRTSTILVRGRRCEVRDLTVVAKPPPTATSGTRRRTAG